MAVEEDWRAELDRVLRKGEVMLNEERLGAEGAADVAGKLRGTRNSVKRLLLDDTNIGDAAALICR
jgi:hypothetical protein